MKTLYRISLFVAGIIVGAALAFTSSSHAATPSKPIPKIDCSKKANASKLECKEAPTSDVKPKVKKPKKVERKAPASVQKKAEQNTK